MGFHNMTLDRQEEDRKKYFPFGKFRTINGSLYVDIDVAIKKIEEAKKEVFDDIEKEADIIVTTPNIFKELKKRHLSTFAKQKQHNSSSKKDCFNKRCKRGYCFDNQCHWKFMYKCEERKRSPS